MAPLAADRWTEASKYTSWSTKYGVGTGRHMYKGAMAMLVGGYLRPAADTAGGRVVGRSEENVDNTLGADAALSCKILRGVFKYANKGGDLVVAADVGKVCYVEDDQTVCHTANANGVEAGYVVAVESDGVWVEQLYLPVGGTITEAEIGAGAVTEAKIGALAVTAGKIGALAVETGKIALLAVTAAQLGALAVETAKINNLAVTNGKLGADAVSGAKLLHTGLGFYAVPGHNLAGACACVGAVAGDKVVGMVNYTDHTIDTAKFETTVTVNDQIQQTAAEDLSTKHYAALLVHKTA